jgi:hypothetical protein
VFIDVVVVVVVAVCLLTKPFVYIDVCVFVDRPEVLVRPLCRSIGEQQRKSAGTISILFNGSRGRQSDGLIVIRLRHTNKSIATMVTTVNHHQPRLRTVASFTLHEQSSLNERLFSPQPVH